MDRTKIRVAALVAIGGIVITACAGGHGGALGAAERLIASCASAGTDVYIGVDASASGKAAGLDESRLRAVTSELGQVAACERTGKVVAFTSSAAAATTLFEGSIELVGATDQARARRLEAAVTEVVDQIVVAFPDTAAALAGGGTDIVAQLRLAAEWRAQLGTDAFRVVILTDGLQNRRVKTKKIIEDPQAAAEMFTVPDLTGAVVVLAGVGQVEGKAPTTRTVDALKTFYTLLCERTGAASCQVVSEIAGATP